MSNSINQQG